MSRALFSGTRSGEQFKLGEKNTGCDQMNNSTNLFRKALGQTLLYRLFPQPLHYSYDKQCDFSTEQLLIIFKDAKEWWWWECWCSPASSDRHPCGLAHRAPTNPPGPPSHATPASPSYPRLWWGCQWRWCARQYTFDLRELDTLGYRRDSWSNIFPPNWRLQYTELSWQCDYNVAFHIRALQSTKCGQKNQILGFQDYTYVREKCDSCCHLQFYSVK